MKHKDLIIKIKENNMASYCNRQSEGCLLVDKKGSGDIFVCGDNDGTYYEKWSDKHNQFILFSWLNEGLDKYDLDDVYSNDNGWWV